MTRPLLIDLFCCAGGAGQGYYEAGFDVLGVDNKPQKNYPFPFVLADVVSLTPAWFRERKAAAVHASPPCQFGTELLKGLRAQEKHANLIPTTRRILQLAGLPYVIENVEAVVEAGHLYDPTILCGRMFGLGAEECVLDRHRGFETNWPLTAPEHPKHGGEPVVGVYGGHARRRSKKHGGRGTQDIWQGGHKTAAAQALGMHWGTLQELSEAIPPAYTRYIGEQLLAVVEARRAA